MSGGRGTRKRNRWLLWLFVLLIGLPAGAVVWDYGVQKNFDTVVPGKIYRSGQPGKAQLEGWVKEYGLKSILTLRHGIPSYEKELADRYGLKLYQIPFSAKTGLQENRWQAIRAILTDANNLPILIHCRGGGDRSGIVTALYRIEVQGWPLEKALHEMSRHYHISLRYPALQKQLRERFEKEG